MKADDDAIASGAHGWLAQVGVGKAFVALQRGLDPRAVLSPAEAAELYQLRERGRGRFARPLQRRAPAPHTIAIVGVIATLGLLALAGPLAAGAASLVAAAGVGLRITSVVRVRRLVAAIDRAAGRPGGRQESFAGVVDGLVESGSLTWAAVVSWSDRSLDGTVELEWRTAVAPPSPEAVTSWLIRELESRQDYVVAEGAELGRQGHFLAVVLRRAGSPIGSLVLGFNRAPGEHVGAALIRRRAMLTELLATGVQTEPLAVPADRPALAAVM